MQWIRMKNSIWHYCRWVEPPVAFTFSSTLMCLFFFMSGKEYKSSFRTAEDGCALEGSSGPLGMKHKHGRVRKSRNITSFNYY